jgi:hypothetical protein
MRGKFLATLTSQRQRFRALAVHQLSLMRRVIVPALGASLVSCIPAATKRRLFQDTAYVTAVGLSVVVGLTHVERPRASTAAQLEDHELVHPLRRDENWTTASGSLTVRVY